MQPMQASGLYSCTRHYLFSSLSHACLHTGTLGARQHAASASQPPADWAVQTDLGSQRLCNCEGCSLLALARPFERGTHVLVLHRLNCIPASSLALRPLHSFQPYVVNKRPRPSNYCQQAPSCYSSPVATLLLPACLCVCLPSFFRVCLPVFCLL